MPSYSYVCVIVRAMKKYERGELAKEILKGFLVVGAAGGIVVTCAVFPGMAAILELFEPKSATDRYRVKRTVRNLERKKLLMRSIKNGKEVFVVTQLGKRQLEQYLMEDLHILPSKKWDKKWRVLMFDIPEKHKRVRDEVSVVLRNMGMHAIQNSVFVSPYPCKDEVDFITGFYRAKEYFIYFETDNIECKEDLLTLFQLR